MGCVYRNTNSSSSSLVRVIRTVGQCEVWPAQTRPQSTVSRAEVQYVCDCEKLATGNVIESAHDSLRTDGLWTQQHLFQPHPS